VRVGGATLTELAAMPLDEVHRFVQELRLPAPRDSIAAPILREAVARLGFMVSVGLQYLSLDRPASTLSGGEAQRIRLATQIGSSLVGVLYVLDEPSIGLHPRDTDQLLGALRRLRDLGNSVLVVEHDEAIIRAADYVIDMGPGAGAAGGHVVATGSPEVIAATPASLTGQHLAGRRGGEPTRAVRTAGRYITVRGARAHNLRNLDVQIPLGLLTCVTGVSGSGKSSLIIDTLLPALRARLGGPAGQLGEHDGIDGVHHIDRVIAIDQSSIGRTPRSNPATYTGVFALVRDLFAQLPESKARGYKAGRYSFNVKGGRCEACQGDGTLRIEMHFLPDLFVQCETCGGRRYNRETLEVRYRGASIADVLDMTVSEALKRFGAVPNLRARLESLREVGLGYLALGQAATTLSGGEAQRLKLAKELAKKATGRSLYIFDEPTTGLHFEDIRQLMRIVNTLVDQGNTAVVIEHNLDVLRAADWIIDLGPEGGDGGGSVVAVGTPAELRAHPSSHTGHALRDAARRSAP
jgi:excinuclease ABC subunit A